MRANLLTIEIRYEQDVVLTRQRARQVALLLGFTSQEQTSIATAVSEIARNAFRYARGGKVEFHVTDESGEAQLLVRVSDTGVGIAQDTLKAILSGQYVSQTGMGLGIIGAKRLSDSFEISSEPGKGTSVTLGKRFARRGHPLNSEKVAQVVSEVARAAPQSTFEELQEQNRELVQSLQDAATRQAEVDRLNAELAETNRGVLALYAELDEKAESLQKASELKSRFLSDLSHELRTPLNAMISLSGLLLERTDGELTPEQDKQVRFIRNSANSLREMVNDLLDLAKIESGKTDLRLSEFHVYDLLAALRGMFRPLLTNDDVSLIIEDAHGLDVMHSDEGKLSQILRNLISNAIKFTERGEVRVTASPVRDEQGNEAAQFVVKDTGIGIAPADQEKVFQDFSQVDSRIQRKVRGTGLGLPLSRKLAQLLGGTITLSSELGVGSTFTVIVPVRCPNETTDDASTPQSVSAVEGGVL